MPEGLEPLERLKQFGCDLIESKVGVEIEQRLEVGRRQALPGVLIEVRAQLWHSIRRKRKPDRVGVTTVAGK